MGLLKKLFGKPAKINAATARIDEQVYLLNYHERRCLARDGHYCARQMSASESRRMAT